jgi:hypothetical protein
MARLPDRELRVILPALVYAARSSPAPNRELDLVIRRLILIAQERGLPSVLTDLDRLEERYRVTMAAQESGPALTGPLESPDAPDAT